MSFAYTKNISAVEDRTKQEILGKSAYALPDVPGDAGYSAKEIKEAFWKPIADSSSSALSEINRVAQEAQEAVEEVREAISDAEASTDASKLRDIGVDPSTPAGCLSLYRGTGGSAAKHLRLADAYPCVTLSGSSLTLTLEPNREYYAGAITSLNLSFPDSASVGDYCYLCFSAGASGSDCTVSVQTTNASDIADITSEFIEGNVYEIMGKWNGSIWMLAVHEAAV